MICEAVPVPPTWTCNGEPRVLFEIDFLIAEEDHTKSQQCLMDLFNLLRAQRLREVDVSDLGADMWRDAGYADGLEFKCGVFVVTGADLFGGGHGRSDRRLA
jgi:hypothetical protein